MAHTPFPPDLILGTAVVMASAAMEAYLQPTSGLEFRSRGPNGTHTQWLHRDFVKANLRALLEVTVKSAQGFLDVDRFTKPDLFIEIAVGGSYGRTEQRNGKANPEFNETLLLWPRQPAGGVIASGLPVLTVSVTDDDLFGEDKIGSGSVPLEAGWESMPPKDIEVKIFSGDKVKGTVMLTLKPSIIADDGSGDAGAIAHKMMASPQLAMPEGAPEALISNVAAAMVLAPTKAALATTDSTVYTASAADQPAAVSDGGDAAAAAAAVVSAAVAMMDGPSGYAAQQAADADMNDATAGEGDEMEAMKQDATDKVKEAWQKLSEVFPDAFLAGGAPIAYFTSESDTHAYMHSNPRLKQVVISFRGTKVPRNWVTNLQFALNSVAQDEATGALRTSATSGQRDSDLRAWLGPISPLTRPSIHRGFYLGYRSVQPQIREVLAMITGGDPSWSVTTTGHSLGGALAVLCAYDIAIARDTPYKVSCFTFGCPRVGNDRFAARFKEQVPNSFRIHNRNDLVPQVPWFLGYFHPPSEIRIDSEDGGDSRLYTPLDNAISVFGDGLVSEEVREKLRSEQGPVAGASRWLRNRAGLIGSLFSREGFSSHSRSEYVQTLAGVMLIASSEERYQVLDAVQAVRDALSALRMAMEANKNSR